MIKTAVRLAVGTLTTIPTGRIERVDARTARWAMILAPLAVLPLAGAAAGAGWLAHRLGAPALIAGGIAVAVVALGNRALHLDGLADTIDGLGSGWDKAKALEVMRRGDVGPMGVVGLVIMLGLQAVAFGALVSSGPGAVRVGLLICASRAALSLTCARGIPAARSEGLGAAVAGTVPRAAAAAVWVGVAAVMAGSAAVGDSSLAFGVVAAVLAGLSVLALVRRCMSRFGGVTGDVMGAAIELACTVLAVISVLHLP